MEFIGLTVGLQHLVSCDAWDCKDEDARLTGFEVSMPAGHRSFEFQIEMVQCSPILSYPELHVSSHSCMDHDSESPCNIRHK